jgi:hypothetical protein
VADPKDDYPSSVVPAVQLIWTALGVVRPPRAGTAVSGGRDSTRALWRFVEQRDTLDFRLRSAAPRTLEAEGRRDGHVMARSRTLLGPADCRRAYGSMSRRGRRGLSSRSWRWIRRRPSLRRCGAVVASVAGLSLGGCLYGFAGGGLPNIKTVAILPFDNETPEPALTQEVADAVREAVENRLGLRASGEASADAVVRGRISRYDPDLPTAVQTGQGQANDAAADPAHRRRRDSGSARGPDAVAAAGAHRHGEYQPPQEAEGRKVALQKLVTEIVDGAQSQW